MTAQIGKVFLAIVMMMVFTINGLACTCGKRRTVRTRQVAYRSSTTRTQNAYYAPASYRERQVVTRHSQSYYREHRGHSTRDKILTVVIPAAFGAGIGGLAGGGKGAGIGALAGGGAGAAYYYLIKKRR